MTPEHWRVAFLPELTLPVAGWVSKPFRGQGQLRHMKRGRRLTISTFDTSFNSFTRVLVRPIRLDVVEVGGSNPPGPTTQSLINTTACVEGDTYGDVLRAIDKALSANLVGDELNHGRCCFIEGFAQGELGIEVLLGS